MWKPIQHKNQSHEQNALGPMARHDLYGFRAILLQQTQQDLGASPLQPNFFQMSWRTWSSSVWRSEPLVNWRSKATTGSIGQMPSQEPSSDSWSSFTAAIMATLLVRMERNFEFNLKGMKRSTTRSATTPNMEILRKFFVRHETQRRIVSLRIVNHVAKASDEIRKRKWLDTLCKSNKMIATSKICKSYLSQITLITLAKLAAFDTRAPFQVRSEFGPPLVDCCSGTCRVAPSN